MIDISSLNKSFGELEVIKDLNLTITKGEVLALVGPSGCGKTTLLNCITGIDYNYSGIIKLNNVYSKEYLKNKRIAIVFQQYSNFEWLTVRQNIETAFKNGNLNSDKRIETVEKLLNDMKLNQFANSYINELSGGMQQRVAVARALAQNTEIMAFDEPFGALDIKNRISLQGIFKNIMIKFNKTSIFITHDIEEAIFLADKVALLSKIPTSIIEIFNTNLLRKESNEIKYSRDFIEIKKEIEKYFHNIDGN